jgi:hypothetical protein
MSRGLEGEGVIHFFATMLKGFVLENDFEHSLQKFEWPPEGEMKSSRMSYHTRLATITCFYHFCSFFRLLPTTTG